MRDAKLAQVNFPATTQLRGRLQEFGVSTRRAESATSCPRKLAFLLLCQPAPARDEWPSIARRGACRFHRTGVDFARFPRTSQAFERLPVVVQAFGVVGPPAGVDLELPAGILQAAGGQVSAAELAQDFVQTVFGILLQ